MTIAVWAVLAVVLLAPVWVLYRRRNFLILLLTYSPFPLYAIYTVTKSCHENHYSEACTWGYINYAFAFFSASLLYMLASLIQLIFSKIKNIRNNIFYSM